MINTITQLHKTAWFKIHPAAHVPLTQFKLYPDNTHKRPGYLFSAITQLSLTVVYQLCVVLALSTASFYFTAPLRDQGTLSHPCYTTKKKFNSFEKTLMFLLAVLFFYCLNLLYQIIYMWGDIYQLLVMVTANLQTNVVTGWHLCFSCIKRVKGNPAETEKGDSLIDK